MRPPQGEDECNREENPVNSQQENVKEGNMETLLRNCKKCKEEKPITDFYYSRKDKDQRRHTCKECETTYASDYYQKNKDKVKRRVALYEAKRDKKPKEVVNAKEESYHKDYPKKEIIGNKRLRNAKSLVEYLMKNPCVVCGEADPIVLELNHTDRINKIDTISNLLFRRLYLWETEEVQGELKKKCEVLCANCHKRHTAEQLGWTKFTILKEGYNS